jgi:hypothetical protein
MTLMKKSGEPMKLFRLTLLASAILLPATSHAIRTVGALSNFDVYNDTGENCHGFEIELDDIQAKDVTYTFMGQRYGKPVIIEDHSDPAHPNRVFIRWQSSYDQTTHQFTKRTIPYGTNVPGHRMCYGSGSYYDNSGCEHFGLGLLKQPSKALYSWLTEDPTHPGTLLGNLPLPGGVVKALKPLPVSIPQPVWTVQEPAVAGQPVVVNATIPVPTPPDALVPVTVDIVPSTSPTREFSIASWVKILETESEKPGDLDDLVSDSHRVPGNTRGLNPLNTVTEIEWQIMQVEYSNPNTDQLESSKNLGDGKENVTRRYEFYKYTGPYSVYDSDGNYASNEALCTSIGPDGIHGASKAILIRDSSGNGIDEDCANLEIVGEYIGAQMSGADVALPLSANNPELPDGEVGVKYPDRPLIFGGSSVNRISFSDGTLPNGNPVFALDSSTGILTGGTPLAAGTASFSLEATDPVNKKSLTANFSLKIVEAVKADNVVVPNGKKDVETSVLLTASNGVSPFFWSAVPKTTGLTATVSNGNTLVLKSPSKEGILKAAVTVTDSLGGTDTRDLTFVIPLSANDVDQDGIADARDNCKTVANTDQRDTDGDGYGNICDPDLNGDNRVNLADLALFKKSLGGANANADFNGDGLVNVDDLTILKSFLYKVPGPSGLHP